MLVSMTACETASQQDTHPTTEQSTESNTSVSDDKPDQTIDESSLKDDETTEETDPVEESATTEVTTEASRQNGAYTYTVYGDIKLTMDVNIDEYITTNNAGQEVFKLSHLAVDLGWWPDNINPESWTFGKYLPDMFTCPTGDMTVFFQCHQYDYNAQFQDYPQISGFTYMFAKNDSFGTAAYDGDIPDEKKYVTASVKGHGADLQYLVPYGIGRSFMASRDDITVLAYLLSRIKDHPEINPFISTGLIRYKKSSSGDRQDYDLP